MSVEERRRLLASAAKFGAVMAVLGLTNFSITDEVFAQDDAALQKLLDHAVETGDMEAAIEKFGKDANLNEAQLKSLRSLSKSDLENINTVREKLKMDQDFKFRSRRG